MLERLHRFESLDEFLIAGFAALLLLFVSATVHAGSGEPAFSVLVFSKTAGFRHNPIVAGIAAIQALGEQNNFRVDATEDANAFSDQNLGHYRAVIFLNTTEAGRGTPRWGTPSSPTANRCFCSISSVASPGLPEWSHNRPLDLHAFFGSERLP